MRVTKLLGWVGVTALVLALTLIFSMLGMGQAQAAPVAPVPALVPCPPGAPPMSSLCSPAGWALAIEAGTATTAQAASAGVAGYASTAASAATVSGGPAALAAGTALTVGINEFVGGTATVDTTATDLALATECLPGWVPCNSWTFTDSFDRSWTFAALVMAAPSYGDTGSALVRVYCLGAEAGAPSQYAAVFVHFQDGTQDYRQPIISPCNASTVGGYVDITVPIGKPLQHLAVSPVAEVGIFWHPPASPDATDGSPGGLVGDMVTEYTCRDGAGVESVGTVTVAVASDLPEVPVEIPAVECPAGSVLVGLTVTWVTTDGEQVLYDYTAPEWVYDIPVEYPGCVGGECTIQLWRIFSDGAPAEWCGVAGVGCQYWWSDANKAQNYECRYGAYTVELGLCAIYRKPGSVSQNAPVIYDPSGRPIGIGQPVISTDPDDFKIFEPVPGPEPDPPVPGPEPEPLPQSGECFPSGWGVFNPVEWVYRPIVCGLTWAYVPPAGSLDGSIERVRVEVGEKPPFDLIEPGYVLVGDFMDEAQSPSCGFENFAPQVGGFNNNAAELSLACEQPAPMQGVYMVTQVLIWLFALYAAVRMIRRSVGSQD